MRWHGGHFIPAESIHRLSTKDAPECRLWFAVFYLQNKKDITQRRQLKDLCVLKVFAALCDYSRPPSNPSCFLGVGWLCSTFHFWIYKTAHRGSKYWSSGCSNPPPPPQTPSPTTVQSFILGVTATGQCCSKMPRNPKGENFFGTQIYNFCIEFYMVYFLWLRENNPFSVGGGQSYYLLKA